MTRFDNAADCCTQFREEDDAPVLEWFAGFFPQVGDALGGREKDFMEENTCDNCCLFCLDYHDSLCFGPEKVETEEALPDGEVPESGLCVDSGYSGAGNTEVRHCQNEN